jgi:hypothetical protein
VIGKREIFSLDYSIEGFVSGKAHVVMTMSTAMFLRTGTWSRLSMTPGSASTLATAG